MSEIKQLPAFDDVAQIFAKAHQDIHPSFAHGCWVGLIVGGRHYSPRDWVDFILQKKDVWTQLGAPMQHILLNIAEATVEELGDIHYVLEVLLPADDEPLDDRLYALSEWCTGFMRGFDSRNESTRSLQTEAQEALADITDICDISVEIGDEPADEENFMEVIEYLRVAISLIHHDLLSSRTHVGTSSSSLH